MSDLETMRRVTMALDAAFEQLWTINPDGLPNDQDDVYILGVNALDEARNALESCLSLMESAALVAP